MSEIPYKCTHCTFKSYTCGILRAHFKLFHNRLKLQKSGKLLSSKGYSSKRITKGFKPNKKFKQQSNTSKFKDKLSCSYCKYTPSKRCNLKQHIVSCHTNIKVFKCQQCKQSFSSKYKLQLHMASHSIAKNFKCHLCSYRASRARNLDSHVAHVHTTFKSFECNLCEAKFKRTKHLLIHKSSVHSPKTFTCKICLKACSSMRSLVNHIRFSHEKKAVPTKCLICHQTYDSLEKLKLHTKRTHGEKTGYKCKICDLQLVNRASLSIHMKQRHCDKKYFKCVGCSKVYLSRVGLRQHVKNVHTNETLDKSYHCSLCSASFLTQHGLTNHYRVHNVKTLKCSLCSETFRERGALRTHLFTHRKTDRYQCSVCSKKCRDTSELKLHIQTHTQLAKNVKCKLGSCNRLFTTERIMMDHWRETHLRLYRQKCSLCGKVCNNAWQLQAHLRTHTKEKPFKCTLCPAGFALRGNLDTHMNRHLGRIRFTCQYCDKKFFDKKDHDKHVDMHTRNEQFKCTKCPSSFKHESILHIHYRKAHNTTASLYKCTFCPQELPTKFEWAAHELKHAGWKYYKCVRCGREFGDASNFRRHVTGKDTMSTCPGGTDMSEDELKTYRVQCRRDWEADHARIIGDKKSLEEIAPKNEKPVFTCRFCQQSFTRKLKWAVHELRHTGWKEYKCVKCGKECGNAATFHQHAYRKVESDNCTGSEGLTKEELAVYYKESKKDWQFDHTRIIGSMTTFEEKHFKQLKQKFICRFCSRELSSRSDFAVHELRHTGWNQYKCIKCRKECSNASTFHAHVYQKYSNDCPGGVGLSKAELDDYRKQCAKDWEADHVKILGSMTQEAKEKIAKQNFARIEKRKSKTNQSYMPINKLSKPRYKCSFCDMKLGTKFEWACHELEHKGWKYFQCVKCGREFSRTGHSTFYEHSTGKRQKQTCPGGKGMNQKDFEAYRNLCKKDWQAEHDRIIGTKENADCSSQNVESSDAENDSEAEHNSPDEALQVAPNDDVQSEFRAIQQQHKMKNCRVVLTPLSNVQTDRQDTNDSSSLNLAAAKRQSRTMAKGYVMKRCTVVLNKLNIVTVMPVTQ